MALCAGLAAITLSLGAIGTLPAAVRRLGAIRVGLPARPIAVVVLLASLVAVTSRPRSVGATVAPPVVRLSEQADAAHDPPTSLAPTVSTAPESISGAGSAVATYVVRPGDSLWRIAERALGKRDDGGPTSGEIARFWPRIYAANRALIGSNPNLIFPGQHLEIPEA